MFDLQVLAVPADVTRDHIPIGAGDE